VSAGDGKPRVPNRLREHREARGLEQWDVAERISALTEDGTPLDEKAVSRHERGVHKPRRRYRRLYQVTEDELWPPSPARLTRPEQQGDSVSPEGEPVLVAAWDHGGTVEAAVTLTGSRDLVERRAFLVLSGTALTAPAHHWLVQEPGRLTAALGGDRVTPQLAGRLPQMITALRRMDDVSNGDIVLGLAQRHFSWVTGLLDHASYDEQTGRQLHRVLAELGQLTGWVAYDAGLHALAQRYWITALRAAHTADDPALGAYIVSWMAQQATEQGRGPEAATLAATALAGTRRRQTPALMARLHSVQAYAQAILQNDSGCARAAAAANSWVQQIKPEDEPPRLYWVNHATVTAGNGRALLRLGRPDQAVRPLAHGVRQLHGSMVRDRQLFLADWAEALARPGPQRDLEQAANRAMQAVTLAEEQTSTRTTHRIHHLHNHLKPHTDVPIVREFLERARELPSNSPHDQPSRRTPR
jgi:hypothetical protein